MRATRDEWERRVRRWRASGLTAERFSGREGLAPRTLRWWAWRLGRETRIAKVPATFVEVAAPGVAPAPLEVVLSDAVRVVVPAGFDCESLRQVLGLFGGR